MSKSNHILIPTNFTISAEKAYEFALFFAEKNNMIIDLIHVMTSTVYLDERVRHDDQLLTLRDKLFKSEYEETEKHLKKAFSDYFPQESRGKYYIESSKNPTEVINDLASKEKYSMIIMSTQKSDSSGRLRTKTPEQVVRNSKIPVVILDEKTDIEEINSIIAPTDGSLLSMSAIPAALTLSELFDTGITLFYVNEAYGLFNNHFLTKSSKNEKYEVTEYLFNRMKDFFETRSDEYELITDEHFKNPKVRLIKRDKTVPLRTKIITGVSAHNEITKYANRITGFVVMATHGRSGLAHLFLGSNTEKVAQNIKVPVMTIRPESKLFEKAEAEAEEVNL